MYKNPLAQVIRDAFMANVTVDETKSEEKNKNTIENILKYKRITLFEKAINRFLNSANIDSIPEIPLDVDENSLLNYAQNISGYLRDAQDALVKLNEKYSHDTDLINLYKSAAKYCVDFSMKGVNSKYNFQDNCQFLAWKVENPNNLTKASFNDDFTIDPKQKNLIIVMPFHIKPEQDMLRYWSNHFLHQITSNPYVFGNDVNVYMVHIPINQSRGEKFATLLDTMRRPDTYFNKADMNFVKKHLLHFIGKNIELNNQNKVTKGTPYTKEELKQNLGNIPILGYCSGATHSHRWVNAISHIAKQLYPEDVVKDSLQNILIVNYAFLPIKEDLKYSGIYVMSNYADDKDRVEPFIKMFNPTRYEENKYCAENGAFGLHNQEESSNTVVSFPIPEKFIAPNDNGEIKVISNVENGHDMGVITQPNLGSDNNLPFETFKSIVKKAATGEKRPQITQYLQKLQERR